MNYQDYLEVSEYKGNKILNLPVGINQNWSFGFNKAVTLSNYSAEIRAFVDTEGKGVGDTASHIIVSEYKGNPVLELPGQSAKYPLRFGIGKARVAIKYLKEIKEFIADNEAGYLESHGFKQ